MGRTAFTRLSAHPALVALLLLAAGAAFAALPTARYGPPLPVLHDEHMYLFEAETFARGRLTNDPPPGPPEFYQTFHEFITPRYVGKAPPGESLPLTVGLWLGDPIFGLWLVGGLWAMALFWMLRAAAPPGWALAGALAGVAGYGAASDWWESYWGGGLFALGGALTLGGALRFYRKRGCPRLAATVAGFGCAIMALTRPFDGFIFALAPVAVILFCARRTAREQGPRRGLARVVMFAVPAVLGVALMLGYNLATTGHPWDFAHRAYDHQFLPRLALFVWDKPASDPPDLPFFLSQYEQAFAHDMAADPLTWPQYFANLKKFSAAQFGFLFPWWTQPLAAIGLVGTLRRRDAVGRIALASLLSMLFPLLTVRFYGFSHYIAAWTAPALILTVQGARRLAAGLRKWRLQPCWAFVLLVLWPVAENAALLARGYPRWAAFAWPGDREEVREDLADRAKMTSRQQLAVVVYAPGHDPHAEWVFNSPDPAAQDVLWLRAVGPERLAELARWFPEREKWLVFVDADGKLSRREPLKLPSAPAADAKSPATKD